MTDLNALLGIGREAVEQGVALLRTAQATHVIAKGDRDMVSDLDLTIERRTRARLRQATPGAGFLGEEEGQHGSADHTWVLDPIDGTANFLRGLPLCGISLALIREGRPVLGIVALPFLSRTYWAGEGLGAWQDQQRIAPSATPAIGEAIVAVGDYAFGTTAAYRNPIIHALHRHLADRAQRVRMLGSAAVDLAWVADGTLDASITIGNNVWDMTAGLAIAREAGARVVDLDGTAHTADSAATIAIAPNVAAELLELIQHAALGSRFVPVEEGRAEC